MSFCYANILDKYFAVSITFLISSKHSKYIELSGG